MVARFSICTLLVVSSLAIASSSIINPHRLAKRNIFDDINGFFNNVKDKIDDISGKIKDFSEEKFQNFKNGLKSMSQVDMQSTLDKLREKYNSVTDKASLEARRLKESMGELTENLHTNGSVPVKSSLVATTGLALLLVILIQ